MEDPENNEQHSNVDLIYDFTKERFKSINDGIDRVTGRLATTLAFSGAMLKFTEDIPENQFWARATVCLLLVAAIGFCVRGITPQKAGEIVKLDRLLEPDIYRAPKETFKITIIHEWVNAIPDLKELATLREECLKMAFICLTTASLLFGLSTVIASIR